MWPARWWTGTSGIARAAANDLANDTPTSSDPTSPGPCVTAMASTASSVTCACSSARSTTPQMSRTCWREASSGTTPPHSRWISDLRRDDVGAHAPGARRVARLLDQAAAVSSQEVSMPSNNIADCGLRIDGLD